MIHILFLLLASSNVLAGCPSGFMTHGQNCYHFSHDSETWVDAVVVCDKVYGGKLAEIYEMSELQYLVREAQVLKTEYWIGGNDLAVEGEWVWQSTRQPITNATLNNLLLESNSANNENCMEVNNGHFNDDHCAKEQHYICQTTQEEIGVIG